MHKHTLLLVVLVILGILLLNPMAVTVAQEGNPPTTTITLPAITLGIDATEALEAEIACVVGGGCSAFDISIAFDPAIIRVDRIELGPYLGTEVLVVENEIDSIKGLVRLAATVLGDMPQPESNVLLTLVITGLAEGTTSLTFTQIDIADAAGYPVPAAEGIAGDITVKPPPDPALGETLFADNCAACHGAREGAGPALPDMAANAADRIEGMSAEEYLHDSIVDPSAYVVEGYADVMPKVYGAAFNAHEIDSVVAHIFSVPEPVVAPPTPEPIATPEPAATPEPIASPEPLCSSSIRRASIADIEAIMPAKNEVGLGGLPFEPNAFLSETRTLSELVTLLNSAGLVQLADITATAGARHGHIAQVVRAWDSGGACPESGLYEFQVLVILFETELGARSHLFDYDMYEGQQSAGAFEEFQFVEDGVLAIGPQTTACGAVEQITKMVPYGRFQIATLMKVRAGMNREDVLAWLNDTNAVMIRLIEEACLD